MSKRSPKSVEEKLEVLNLYLTHHQSIRALCQPTTVDKEPIYVIKKRRENTS